MRLNFVRRLVALLLTSGKRSVEDVPSNEGFTESELNFGRLVLPLLEDMDAMKRELDEMTRRAHALDVVVGKLPVAALVLDSEGRFLTMNRTAKDLFGGAAITAQVLSAARRAAGGNGDGAETLVAHPGQKGAELRLIAADVAEAEDGSAEAGERPSVVFVVSPEAPPVDTAPLVSRFGLTRSEANVVAQVARGLSNKDAAEALELSPETVRKHLAAAFRKTGARNRAAIVALVFGARYGQGPIPGTGLAAVDEE